MWKKRQLEKEGKGVGRRVNTQIVISTYGLYSQSVKTDPMADLITVSVSSMLNSAVRAFLLLSVAMMVVACPWLLEITVVVFVTGPNDR